MADKLKLVDQYAIMLLESDPNAYSEEWNADYERGFLDAINKALELPTIEAEPVNGWISVKDRLPDNVEEVRIYCPEFCEEIKQATWCGEDFFVEREDLIVEPAPNGYCTHWMPLPEPPKEDKDG